ncbi:MAG TPA: type II and III secretion system protein [Terriglobales bacterium]|nr:type II and III secretion system protein [Terriglobales bacterium]
MKRALPILMLLLASAALAQTAEPAPASPGCAKPESGCTAQEPKQARQSFERGVTLAQAGRSREALDAFDTATQLAPKNLEYLTAREAFRQQVVLGHLQRGNNFLVAGKSVEAMAEFRGAAEVDPANAYAGDRLREAVIEPDADISPTLRVVWESTEIELAPAAGRKNFHYRGDTRGLIQEITRAFGVKAVFDDSMPSRPVRFDLEDADFVTAMRIAAQMSKSFWTPLSSTEMLVAADNAENRRQFERMSLRTFYLEEAASAKEFTELTGLLRTLFDVRFVTVQPEARSLQIRAPKPVLDAVTQFLDGLAAGRPQVEMNVEVLEVARTARHNIGTQLPLQFRLLHLPSEVLALASNPSIQDLINQLIQSGGINQANAQAVAALLAQLQASPNSLLGQPIATFGGGRTLFGVVIPPASAQLEFNDSRVSILENAALRAAEGDAATLKIGTRFPILNATFAPLLNSPALSKVIENNSFRPAFPSFQYQDLGLVLKATPHVHNGGSDISLQLELDVSALGSQSLNGIPLLSHRQYTGSLTLKEGETAVVAGAVSRSEQRILAGLPGLGQVPVLGKLTAHQDSEHTVDELIIVITPRLVRRAEQNLAGREFWMPPTR